LTRSNQAQAPGAATGTTRDHRRPRGARRPAWVRPLVRAHFGIRACARLIDSTLEEVAACRRQVHRRPFRTWRRLYEATDRLSAASNRLTRAMRDLGRTGDCIARDPENTTKVQPLLVVATQSWVEVGLRLSEVVGEVFTFNDEVFHGITTGTLAPERAAERCMQFALAFRPVPFRAFVLRRHPRVIDRIALVLHRRRRTPRPTALTVPRVTDQGRAPPRFSVCPL